MKRVLEPGLMDDPEQVAAYAGHAPDDAYWVFEQCFRRLLADSEPDWTILDLGCGPADIPIRLAKLFPDSIIHGVDGSRQMLQYGREAVQREGLEHQVLLIHGVLPNDVVLPRSRYEVVVSNSFLHHLEDPMIMWDSLRRYGQGGAAVLVIDLIRPSSYSQAVSIVEKYMADAPRILRQDMIDSLCAAFTMEEVEAQLQDADIAANLQLKRVTPFQFAVQGRLPRSFN